MGQLPYRYQKGGVGAWFFSKSPVSLTQCVQPGLGKRRHLFPCLHLLSADKQRLEKLLVIHRAQFLTSTQMANIFSITSLHISSVKSERNNPLNSRHRESLSSKCDRIRTRLEVLQAGRDWRWEDCWKVFPLIDQPRSLWLNVVTAGAPH